MEIYLLLGGNIGPVRENLRRAEDLIALRVGRVVRASRVYRSPAWGFESPDPFYNVALAVETALTPAATMQTLLQIEKELGRQRPGAAASGLTAGSVPAGTSAAASRSPERQQLPAEVRWPAAAAAAPSKTYASRPIDIDILFFGSLVLDTPLLTVPHPRLPLRRFALRPLCDIAPALVHPLLHRSVADLLAVCPDASDVVPVA